MNTKHLPKRADVLKNRTTQDFIADIKTIREVSATRLCYEKEQTNRNFGNEIISHTQSQNT